MDQIKREIINYTNILCEDDILKRHSEIFVSHLEFILLREVIIRISLNIE